MGALRFRGGGVFGFRFCVASLGVLLVGSWDFNFLGFYMNHNKEAKSLTFWRGSEVSQVPLTLFPMYSETRMGCRGGHREGLLGDFLSDLWISWQNPESSKPQTI